MRAPVAIVSSFPVGFDLTCAESFPAAATKRHHRRKASFMLYEFNYFGAGTTCKTADVSFKTPYH